MTVPKCVRIIRGQTVDLESRMFKLEAGKTYFDEGTTVLDVYIDAGIRDGSMEPAKRDNNTISVGYRP